VKKRNDKKEWKRNWPKLELKFFDENLMEFLFSEDKICITGALGAPVENSLKIVKKKLVVLSWHTSGANNVEREWKYFTNLDVDRREFGVKSLSLWVQHPSGNFISTEHEKY
jgi:hypothetical protein